MKYFFLALCFFICTSASSFALLTDTHSHINGAICTSTKINQYSNFDDFLKGQLNIKAGIGEFLKGKMIQKIIEDGGIYEDTPPGFSLPYARSMNHFHDPISDKGFTGSIPGLSNLLGYAFESSVLWAQDPNQYLGKYSWPDARNYFYNALTASGDNAEDIRQQNYADCFRAMGQLMHLIQDASVPAHVRNDGRVV